MIYARVNYNFIQGFAAVSSSKMLFKKTVAWPIRLPFLLSKYFLNFNDPHRR